MDLAHIQNRIAEAIPQIDSSVNTVRVNLLRGKTYLPGLKTMTEKHFVEKFADWWLTNHPGDFDNPTSERIALEVKYKNTKRSKCDLLVSKSGNASINPDWAIEIKNIALVGNNGKTNDFVVAKILSPYKKDRSLKHDAERLASDPFCANQAVIGYSFTYSFTSLLEAEKLHPSQLDVISNLRKVCRSVDSQNGIYSPTEMIDFADDVLVSRNVVLPSIRTPFTDAWRHPAGGNGYVFGWQVINKPQGQVSN